VEFPNYGDAGERYSIILTRNGESTVMYYNTTLPQVFNLSLEQNDVVLLEAVAVIENLPPNVPAISGPSNGKVNTDYTYSVQATEPDGDHILYMFDWGDGTTSDWIGPFDPSETCTANHSWSESKTYEIRAKAKDDKGAESEWSDPLPVSIPLMYQTLLEKIMVWILQLFGITVF